MADKPIGMQVDGLAAVLKSLKTFDVEAAETLKDELRKAAGVVRDDAASRFAPFNERSADGYRVYVRARGVDVEQSIGRTTGLRPDFGALQMREALLPALSDHEQDTYEAVESALSALASRF